MQSLKKIHAWAQMKDPLWCVDAYLDDKVSRTKIGSLDLELGI